MKTNLDTMFKTSSKAEQEGIDFIISDGVSFRVKRWHGPHSMEVRKLLAHKYKPYARQIQDGTISEAKATEIITTAFVETCVIGWDGVEIDGEKKPFSKEECIKLLIALPELCNSLLTYAQDTKNYREDLGNF